MAHLFGTDGIRGIVGSTLTHELAFACGRALSAIRERPHIVIGRDTRVSGEYLTLAIACGAVRGGAAVTDLGVVPTAGVSYLVRLLGADFGVVISASHNPREYNGIKIFDSRGYKLSDADEALIEREILNRTDKIECVAGRFLSDSSHVRAYEDFLVSCAPHRLDGLSVALDCADGAACAIAPRVFERLGARVCAINATGNGERINDGSGALYPEGLSGEVRRMCADVGFAFDGDADRLIAVGRDGSIIDGDMMIYMFARHMNEQGRLKKNTVVGTVQTNMGIERALADRGIKLVRTDVGDKYVLERLLTDGLSLGGEQSGHIIFTDLHSTGDGILSAIMAASLMIETRRGLEELFDAPLYPQRSIGVTVSDKQKIIADPRLFAEVEAVRSELGDGGRMLVRASGTEPKIRVSVESWDGEKSAIFAERLAAFIAMLDAK